MDALVVPDLRVTGNQTMHVTSEDDVRRALQLRYGAAELDAMLEHDPVARTFIGDSAAQWSRAAAFFDKRAVHEFCLPTVHADAFQTLERKYAADVVHTVIGLSPTTGWAAVLAGPPDAANCRLYVRNAQDRDRSAWRRHRGLPKVGAVRAASVSGVWATLAVGATVYVVDMSSTTSVLAAVSLEEPPVHVASNGRYLAVSYADGQLGVVQLGTGGVTRMPVVAAAPQAAAVAAGVHPLTGEPLEPLVPAVEEVTYRAARLAFNQLGDDTLAVSMLEGRVLLCALSDAGVTPLTMYELGPAPSLAEDPPLRHPPQEPAGSLCLRVRDGDGILAQCGWHLSYRQLADVDVGAPVVPRFPTLFVADVGPLTCVGVCGTTIVTHARNDNMVRIGSLVPGAHDPHNSTARFGIAGAQWSHPMAGDAAPYASLCVLPTVLYCLLPNGTMLTSEPTGAARRIETDIPAV